MVRRCLGAELVNFYVDVDDSRSSGNCATDLVLCLGH
jgi:hypothetical protein